jgi:hypothetical protein
MKSKAQIGKCGELLVQFALLSHGIESAPLTTDNGIDLVAFSPQQRRATNVQVKTNNKAKPAGGKGRLHLEWWADDNSAADVFAFVDLDSRRIWVVDKSELESVAQQHPKGRFHFFMTIDPTTPKRRDGKPVHDTEFEKYLFEHSISRVFGDLVEI